MAERSLSMITRGSLDVSRASGKALAALLLALSLAGCVGGRLAPAPSGAVAELETDKAAAQVNIASLTDVVSATRPTPARSTRVARPMPGSGNTRKRLRTLAKRSHCGQPILRPTQIVLWPSASWDEMTMRWRTSTGRSRPIVSMVLPISDGAICSGRGASLISRLPT